MEVKLRVVRFKTGNGSTEPYLNVAQDYLHQIAPRYLEVTVRRRTREAAAQRPWDRTWTSPGAPSSHVSPRRPASRGHAAVRASMPSTAGSRVCRTHTAPSGPN